jgi:hypothetical protein
MDGLLPALPQEDGEPLPLDIVGPDRATAGWACVPAPVVDTVKAPEALPEEVREEGRQGDPLHPYTPGTGSSPFFDKDRKLGCIWTITLRFSTDNHQFFGAKQYP